MTYLPELLRGILPSNTFKDLGATRVFVDEVGYVVDIAVDDNVEALIRGVVGGNVSGRERLGHFEGGKDVDRSDQKTRCVEQRIKVVGIVN